MRSLKEKDERRAARAKVIREHLLGKHLQTIDGEAEREGWGHLLFIHICRMSSEIARAEVDFGMESDAALRWANSKRRPYDAKNPHDPNKVFSDPDIAAWKAMGPQQRRVAPKKRARDRDTGRPTAFGAIPNPNTKGRQLTKDQILESLSSEQRREYERSWERRANFVDPEGVEGTREGEFIEVRGESIDAEAA
jgi:hypothetical protein